MYILYDSYLIKLVLISANLMLTVFVKHIIYINVAIKTT